VAPVAPDGIRARPGFLRLAVDVLGAAMVESATSGAKRDIGRSTRFDHRNRFVAGIRLIPAQSRTFSRCAGTGREVLRLARGHGAGELAR
jgi:hypothetical protein